MITVAFASRGRPDSLTATIGSLFGKADDPLAVEVLIAADPDDPATRQAAEAAGAFCWTAPERFGYCRLHDYLNPLAKQARGEWVMWLNDDMTMETYGWDTVICENRPAVLWPQANHVPHANIAPAWPKAWSDALGYASPTSHMDTYLQRLGEAVGRHDRIPVSIRHDRADVTGGHNDQTYAEGRFRLGPEGMVPGFDAVAFHAQVDKDAAIIRGLLETG